MQAMRLIAMPCVSGPARFDRQFWLWEPQFCWRKGGTGADGWRAEAGGLAG